MFKRRRFAVEIILICVRWYCKVWDQLSRSGGDDAGARRRSGSIHNHAVGPSLRA
jgi:hypothetical protein